jgi:hypothetical protein
VFAPRRDAFVLALELRPERGQRDEAGVLSIP